MMQIVMDLLLMHNVLDPLLLPLVLVRDQQMVQIVLSSVLSLMGSVVAVQVAASCHFYKLKP